VRFCTDICYESFRPTPTAYNFRQPKCSDFSNSLGVLQHPLGPQPYTYDGF